MEQRKKIADYKVNDQAVIALVVMTATQRETRAKKPYLQLEFFDGTEKILANYWDWSSNIIPEKNAVLNVTCTVTEWQGNKQLNVSKLNTCKEYTLSDFIPSSGIDVEHVYSKAVILVNSIEDEDLRNLCSAALQQLEHLWKAVPGAITIHHAYEAGTLVHCVDTAMIAKGIAYAIEEANQDLVVAAALLHDLGKLFAYQNNGVVIEPTDEGHLFEHTFLGANFISNFADNVLNPGTPASEKKVSLLVHCILAHHGKLDYGAAVPPVMLEAHIVSHADGLSAAAEIIRNAKPQGHMWTERIWSLENKPHVQPAYTAQLFGVTTE